MMMIRRFKIVENIFALNLFLNPYTQVYLLVDIKIFFLLVINLRINIHTLYYKKNCFIF